MENLTEGKEKLIPSDGVIYATRKVTFYEGESVFDVLLRETKNNRVHMEYSFNPLFNSNYIEAINNLYEFDCGQEFRLDVQCQWVVSKLWLQQIYSSGRR